MKKFNKGLIQSSGRAPFIVIFFILLIAPQLLLAANPNKMLAKPVKASNSIPKSCVNLIKMSKRASAPSLKQQAIALKINNLPKSQQQACGKALLKAKGVNRKLIGAAKINPSKLKKNNLVKTKSKNYLDLKTKLSNQAATRIVKLNLGKVNRKVTRIPAPNLTPSIERIAPQQITPGISLVIEGNHFGRTPGDVKLFVDGKVYNLAPLNWTNRWLEVAVPEDITGVKQTSNAELVVNLPNGNRDAINRLEFKPTIQVVKYPLELESPGYIRPFYMKVDFFTGQRLKNQWVISGVDFQNNTEGSCFWNGQPRVGGVEMGFSFGINSGWFSPETFCSFTLTYQGPIGLDPGVLERFAGTEDYP